MIKKIATWMKQAVLGLALCLSVAPVAMAQAPTIYTNAVYPAAVFTATNQTSSVITFGNNPSGNGGSYAVGNISVTGVALTTVTFAVQGSSDGGNTYYALNINAINAPGTSSTTATATAAGVYQVNLSGITNVKFVTSGTFTATSVSIVLTASPNGIIARAGSAGSPVQSVFGRTGNVVANTGDYSVSQVTGAASLASPALTGNPTAPTAATGTNTTQIATTALVHASAGMTLISEQTVSGSTTTSVTFSSIPQTYRHLVLVSDFNFSFADVLSIQFNGDTTTAHYAWGLVEQSSGTASASQNNSTTSIQIGVKRGISNVTISNYSGTSPNGAQVAGTFGEIVPTAASVSGSIAGAWTSTAAITSIVIFGPAGADIDSGSTFSLYGME